MRTTGGGIVTMVILWSVLAAGGCSGPQSQSQPQADESAEGPSETELRRLPIDTLSAVLTKSNVQFDPNVSSDGNGSLRITVDKPMVIRLYEMGHMDVEDTELIYRASLRTEDVEGRVYLEMWCHFPGRGASYSRAVQTALSGTSPWTVQETSFDLDKGVRPENVRLNVVVDGSGTAWVDDIRLLRTAEVPAAADQSG
jgi:hypothetical protein